MIGVLFVKIQEISRIKGQDDPLILFSMREMNGIGRDLNIVAGFDEKLP